MSDMRVCTFAGAAILMAAAGPVCSGQCDPEEIAKVLASDGDDFDEFGTAVAISGDTALVGSPLDDHSGRINPGSAYIFARTGDAWIQQARISAVDPAMNAFFGQAVAISEGGDVALIGAINSAYVFTRDGGVWQQQAKLTVDGASAFGAAVAISDGTALISDKHEDHSGGKSVGAAYVFTRNGTTWSLQQRLISSDPEFEDLFGWSVALSPAGDTAAIGATFCDDTGAAYLFQRNGGAWVQEAKVTASDAGENDLFGWSIALAEDAAIVGSTFADAQGIEGGAAYIYTRSGGVWSEQAKLIASVPGHFQQFGRSVGLTNEAAVVGEIFAQTGGVEVGAVYLFRRVGSLWNEEARLFASDAGEDDRFGSSVATSEGTFIVGAPRDDNERGRDAGAAYVFDLNCDTGIPATLTDFTVAFGSLITGQLQDLVESDDAWLRTRSIPGFTSEEANLMELRVGAVTAVQSPDSLDLTLEGRINQPGGAARVRLRNWTTNSFQQIHQYTIGFTEAVETIEGIDATNFVRASDGRIEVSLRHSVFATFSVLGFDSYTDQVAIGVR